MNTRSGRTLRILGLAAGLTLSLSACVTGATTGAPPRSAGAAYLVCTGGSASRLPTRQPVNRTCRLDGVVEKGSLRAM
jgi:hypothetical protein